MGEVKGGVIAAFVSVFPAGVDLIVIVGRVQSQLELLVVAINGFFDQFLDGSRSQRKINGILAVTHVNEDCNFIERLFESLERLGNQALFGGLSE